RRSLCGRLHQFSPTQACARPQGDAGQRLDDIDHRRAEAERSAAVVRAPSWIRQARQPCLAEAIEISREAIQCWARQYFGFWGPPAIEWWESLAWLSPQRQKPRTPLPTSWQVSANLGNLCDRCQNRV